MWQPSGPVVVGVDGSDAAINAALWAIDEAVHHDVPMRLVHVSQLDQTATVGDDYRIETQFAESILQTASAAVHAVGKEVKVDTEILYGAANTALIDESADATMLCLGSVGIGSFAMEFLGSTVVAVTENAYCPVAVLRTPHHRRGTGDDWIVVVVEDHADNEAVIEHAMEEARLRKAPVLAVGAWRQDLGGEPYDEVDRRMVCWKRRYEDVVIHTVATMTSIGRYLGEECEESVQLAVVGRTGASSVPDLVGPHGHGLIPHARCSVLVVR
jgi:nucleotide-binding universal stress UspA family protein